MLTAASINCIIDCFVTVYLSCLYLVSRSASPYTPQDHLLVTQSFTSIVSFTSVVCPTVSVLTLTDSGPQRVMIPASVKFKTLVWSRLILVLSNSMELVRLLDLTSYGKNLRTVLFGILLTVHSIKMSCFMCLRHWVSTTYRKWCHSKGALMSTNRQARSWCHNWLDDWPTTNCCFVVIGRHGIPQFFAAAAKNRCRPSH